MNYSLNGLIAASYTPMHQDGSLCLEQIGPMVDHLERMGVDGIFVCGSTGEGIHMTLDERKKVAEAYLEKARGRLTCIMHVGHNCLADAQELALHARSIGAEVFSAVAPSYFKPGTTDLLVDTMAEIAGTVPELPFYYYHIPVLTGIPVDIIDFLEKAADRIPNLAGVKYTSFNVHDFQSCRRIRDGQFDMVWGFDEMMLSGLVVGAQAFIGSTYNFGGPLYVALVDAFRKGDLEQAKQYQELAVEMIRILYRYPFHSAVKSLLTRMGVPCGPCRLPQASISDEAAGRLWEEFEKLGVPEWWRKGALDSAESNP